MNDPRSPDPHPADDPQDEASEPPSWDEASREPREAPSRSFLGRIFKTLGPLSSDNEDGPDSMMEAATSAQAPSILNLRRKTVDDVAVNKADIVAVPVTVGLPELVEVFREHGYSRLPVHRGNLDQPLGLVHLKDLALKHGFASKGAPRFALRPLLRPLLYVPGTMPIGALLQQMQQKRIHMALVIDEYGGVEGLVTIEDLIEQVIGQIDDEHDDSNDELWVQERPGQWLVLARAPIDRVEAEIGTKLVCGIYEEEIDTVGGLIFMLAGRVPVVGEIVRDDNGVEFEVVDADARRIKRVRLRLPGSAAGTTVA
ncbi:MULTISPECIES: transporter associated domain-containing protein [unclassified Paracoccus (in: a-proteobacteria)]|uniref:transporter associated domain-containing protein n=1 Tax=unclassified Paracoccus (in: a-proteobacteria) TaxID=2688777 RepID=UPI0015FF4138|nr:MULTISPECIES: hemolysin family protein [unclassified Paracoccus (in: a-proteobacteria)]MBB1491956.1 HlyC/CorC family transporter [Paracoccus sp. MC1854]MBB1498181.1 HlyC/CorC family transporter [Paracoccus sp. MC1862]QQO45678.1 HlyC/CorC family transporter [Paracoccus sp. MC1862]